MVWDSLTSASHPSGVSQDVLGLYVGETRLCDLLAYLDFRPPRSTARSWNINWQIALFYGGYGVVDTAFSFLLGLVDSTKAFKMNVRCAWLLLTRNKTGASKTSIVSKRRHQGTPSCARNARSSASAAIHRSFHSSTLTRSKRLESSNNRKWLSEVPTGNAMPQPVLLTIQFGGDCCRWGWPGSCVGWFADLPAVPACATSRPAKRQLSIAPCPSVFPW